MSNFIDRIDYAKEKAEMFLIGARIKAKKAVQDFLKNEDGDIVQTVIIIAVFASLAVVVTLLIGNAIKSRAEDAESAINGFKTYE